MEMEYVEMPTCACMCTPVHNTVCVLSYSCIVRELPCWMTDDRHSKYSSAVWSPCCCVKKSENSLGATSLLVCAQGCIHIVCQSDRLSKFCDGASGKLWISSVFVDPREQTKRKRTDVPSWPTKTESDCAYRPFWEWLQKHLKINLGDSPRAPW